MHRFLEPPRALPVERSAAVVVVGSGVAGLSAALAAAETADVVVVTKSWLSDSNTDYAQGGVAAVLSPGDTFEKHGADTIEVGQGLCHEAVVRRVVEGGARAIERLIGWGGQFDRRPGGELSLGLEAGHSADRIVHAMGDGTGREIQRVLVDRVRRTPRITVLEHAFALDVRVAGDRASGVVVQRGGQLAVIEAGAVIVATGGSGQVFRETTNPEIATGDGHALLFRAGVPLRGMEFMQFHPTTLYVAGSSRLLISEAARGEGAILRDCHGTAFMAQHPQGELAPRDTLSRAVLDQMVKTRHPNVYLDLRHLPPAFVRQRFPRIHRVCLTFGLDITSDLIPVTPAAHYMIGGAVVDADGRTPGVAGLWAVGEVACSGLHGANRLASNSLLEGLVLGDHAGRVAAGESRLAAHAADDEAGPQAPRGPEDRDFSSGDLLNSMKSLMWKRVGIVRSGLELAEAERRIEAWRVAADRCGRATPRDWELRNLLTVARLITRAARERAESRGTHFRTDFKARDDARWRADLVLRRSRAGEIELERVPLDAPLEPPRAPREFGE